MKVARIILFVDDLRDPPKTQGLYYQVARTLDEAKRYLKYLEYREISLDFALGENGETCLDLLEYIKKEKIEYIQTINIHTDNERRIEMVRYIKDNFPNIKITHHLRK